MLHGQNRHVVVKISIVKRCLSDIQCTDILLRQLQLLTSTAQAKRLFALPQICDQNPLLAASAAGEETSGL